MKTVTEVPRIFVFDAPAPELLEEMSVEYYRECRIVGAGSVEIKLRDHSTVVVSATRYLPAGVTVGGAVINGVLQVICVLGDGQRVVMREFTDWASYTVHRAQR